MSGFTRRGLEGQGGYSMAEVVIALVIFMAAVTGISGMLLSGSADVRIGALEATATNLAVQKLEEVKGLPFYRPWDVGRAEGERRQDIDDFYYNPAVANEDQFGNPKPDIGGWKGGVESPVPGHPRYTRETCVQYRHVTPAGGEGGYREFGVAEMAENWVPSGEQPDGGIVPPNFDYPTAQIQDEQGLPIETQQLHAIEIQVTVKYREKGVERKVVQRGLAGDFFAAGAVGNPMLVALGISPSSATMEEEVDAVISIYAPGLESEDERVVVNLWYPGWEAVEGTLQDIDILDGGYAKVHYSFDFGADPHTRAGPYHLEVVWGGWRDNSLENCFTVTAEPPRVTRLEAKYVDADHSYYDWGYYGQSPDRDICIKGENLSDPQMVTLVSPGGEEYNEGVVGFRFKRGDRNTIYASLKLSSIKPGGLITPEGVDTRWDIKVETPGGSDVAEDVFRMNPPPEIISIEGGDPASGAHFYRKKQYTNVRIRGKYFHGAGDIASNRSKVELRGTRTLSGDRAEVTDVREYFEGGENRTDIYVKLDFRLSPAGPFVSGQSGSENGTYQAMVIDTNRINDEYDLEDQTSNAFNTTLGNAPLDVTGVTPSSVCYNDWDVDVTVTGKYFDPENTEITFPADLDQHGIYGTRLWNGTYNGSDQTIRAKMSTINLINQNYRLKVKDTENLESDTVLVNVTLPPAALQVPGVGEVAPTGFTWPQDNAFKNSSGCADSLTDATWNTRNQVVGSSGSSNVNRTFNIICKKMRNTGVTWWFRATIGGDVYEPGKPGQPTVTITRDRDRKYVMATFTLSLRKFTYSQFFNVKASNDGSTYGTQVNERIRLQNS